jgi:outer membrane protein assembly factor BamB
MRHIATLAALGFLIGLIQPAHSADWPGWLGPTRDGASPETVRPWQGKPPILWRVPAGEGHSSPVVADGKVLVFSKVKDQEAEELTCLDAATGKKLWSTPDPRPLFTNQFGNGPRATPLVADGTVYTHGASGIVVARELASGKILWRVDSLKEFNGKNMFFGASSSPLLARGRLILLVGGQNAGIVALDPGSGKTLWTATDDRSSYSSPIHWKSPEGDRVLALTGKGLACLNLADGKRLWHYDLVDQLNESSTTPIVLGSRAFVSSVTAGGALVDLANQGKQLWKSAVLNCYFSTPCPTADGKALMIVTGRILPPVSCTLRCVDPETGKVLWSRQKTGQYHAALLRLADGRMLLHEDTGELALLEPDMKAYKELCRSRISGPTWSHPALANGRLYLRDEKELFCVELK